MKTIRFYLIDHQTEIFNTFRTLEELINFLRRLKYIRNKSLIISNGDEAFEYEKITETLPELHKKIVSDMNTLIKA